VNANRARFGLLGIFLGSLVVQLIIFFALRQRMWPEDFQALVAKALAIYSVHVGVILGGIFTRPKGRFPKAAAPLAWTALSLAALWNLLLLGRTASFGMASEDSPTELIKYFEAIGSGGSFLVSGVMVFFFGKSTDNPRAKT
jgi:hypothetical protein